MIPSAARWTIRSYVKPILLGTSILIPHSHSLNLEIFLPLKIDFNDLRCYIVIEGSRTKQTDRKSEWWVFCLPYALFNSGHITYKEG